MDQKEAAELAKRHAETSGLRLHQLELHLLEFNNWMFWGTATDGTKWFIAVDDLDGEVLMMQNTANNESQP
jgi:hypothetical protein